MMEIVLTIIGAIVGWMANHFYSQRGSQELSAANAELKALRDSAIWRCDSSEDAAPESQHMIAFSAITLLSLSKESDEGIISNGEPSTV